MNMSKKIAVPDAWDDDWVSQADQGAPIEQHKPEPACQPPQSKAHILAQHAESNRKLWESAETPKDTFHFLEANDKVPLTSSFKPQVKVLSRKPTSAMAQLSLDDADADAGKTQLSPEQIRVKQRRDREEKQRRYDEARARILGGSGRSSGTSSPGTVTPPRSDGQHTPRGRGRGRGGMGIQRNKDTSSDNRGALNNQRNNDKFNDSRGGVSIQRNSDRNNDNHHFDGRRQNNQQGAARELYDPNFGSKPETSLQGQGRGIDSDGPPRLNTPKSDQQPAIRAPRGPDGSGKGGFGFARRGDKES